MIKLNELIKSTGKYDLTIFSKETVDRVEKIRNPLNGFYNKNKHHKSGHIQ